MNVCEMTAAAKLHRCHFEPYFEQINLKIEKIKKDL